jgi:hypothetical protein
VFFAPHSLEHVNATLYIKNNLTIVDAVELTGEGGSGQLLFEVRPHAYLSRTLALV